MKIINLFLLKHFLRVQLLSIGAFIGIYLLIDFFEKIGDFVDHKASAADYLIYFINSVPLIFSQILPLAILMTVVLTLGGLGRTNEITAMRASGISLWRIVRPFMLFAFCLSLLLAGLNEYILPLNAKALNELLEVKLKGNSQFQLKHNEIWYRDNDRIINIKVVNPEQQNLAGVTVFTLDDKPGIIRRQEAERAEFVQGKWQTEKTIERIFDPDSGDQIEVIEQKNGFLDINRGPADFAAFDNRNNELNFQQLYQLTRKLELEGIDTTRHRVDMHGRLAAPLTCLIMAFLGVPFALQRGRGSNAALGIGLSLGIGVIYFILQSLVTAFGYSNALPPFLAAWTANFIFLLLGIWMLLSVKE